MEILKRMKQNKVFLLLLVVIGIPVGLLMIKKPAFLNAGIILLFIVANKELVRRKKSK